MEEHYLFCRDIPKQTTKDEIFCVTAENHETRHYINRVYVYVLHWQEYVKASTSRVYSENTIVNGFLPKKPSYRRFPGFYVKLW